MNDTASDTKFRLETMIDDYGLCGVLDMIGDLCGEKADHVQTNWGDKMIVSHWKRAAKEVEAARVKLMASTVLNTR